MPIIRLVFFTAIVFALTAQDKLPGTEALTIEGDLAASMVDGRTVGELDPNSRSAEEIASLWLYVNSQLMKYRSSGTTDLRKRGRTHG